jgi:hypothetical protein
LYLAVTLCEENPMNVWILIYRYAGGNDHTWRTYGGDQPLQIFIDLEEAKSVAKHWERQQGCKVEFRYVAIPTLPLDL